MANTFLTPTAVTREALRVLHQKLNFVGSITREYDKSFAKQGAKIGDTLKIRMPNQYVVRTGATLSAQDTTETNVELKVQTQKGVDLNFTSVDLTMNLDDFSDRILEPAMSVLAANIESDAMSMYKDVAQSVWNGGSANTLAKIGAGRALLQNALAPGSGRTANLNVQDMADIVDASKSLFNSAPDISKQYREGYVGRQGGFDYAENTMWPGHTRGAGVSYLVNDTVASGDEVITVDTGTGAVAQGDVFTIAGVFKVHPETKLATSILQQFVLTAAATSGANTWSVSPAMISTGAKQNISALPADNAAITFLGTASTAVGTSLLYQKGAFAFATADLQMPKGVDFSARENFDGISLRIVRQYDINNDKFPCRLDVLYGYKTLRAQLATRLHNN
ncbi:MAG TPA: P22 phage major capsid protein family protein [Phenylobacterium sp.]|nr:P22 phage major capsid protein family protein [Phenylobacterium sp.]